MMTTCMYQISGLSPRHGQSNLLMLMRDAVFACTSTYSIPAQLVTISRYEVYSSSASFYAYVRYLSEHAPETRADAVNQRV